MPVIWKSREASQNKEGLQVLLRRLPKTHAVYGQLQKESYMEAAGQGGEARFDHFFAKSHLTFPHLMLHNVTLRSFRAFQMDSMLITPWCVYVFEIKNLNGRLLFNSHPIQMLQTREDGTVVGRKSPIEQITENEWLLDEWLNVRGFYLPVRSVLALSYSKQIAENVPATQTVIFSHQLPMFLHKLPIENAVFNLDEMKGLAEAITAGLVTFETTPLCSDARYPIGVMRRGVWCAGCDSIGMVRRYGTWFCPDCGVSTKDAHLRTIRDWLLLTGGPLTNRMCREILCVDDRHLVSRLLKEMNLNKIGTFKDAKYQL